MDHSISGSAEDSKQLAIYTCITNCYDYLKEPEYISPKCDYICFTDNKGFDSFQTNVWKLRRLDELSLDPSLLSRMPKILPHRFLGDYRISVWLDGTYLVHGDLARVACKFLTNAEMALFRHAENRPNIRAEADECCRLGKGDSKVIHRQVDAYLQEGYPDKFPLPQNNIIFRRHHRQQVIKTMEFWWEQMMQYSGRDQLSFLYAAWKQGLEFDMYNKKALSPFVKHLPHGFPSSVDSTRRFSFFKKLKLSLRHALILKYPGIYRC